MFKRASKIRSIGYGLGRFILKSMCGGCKCCVHKNSCNLSQGTNVAEMQEGETGTIDTVTETRETRLKNFYDRGLKPGVSVKLLQKSKSNSPVLLSIDGRMIAVRPDEAERFMLDSDRKSVV